MTLRWLSLGLACCFMLGAAAEEAVSMSIWAVHATTEGHKEKHFDKALTEVKSVLATMPHDTFKEVKTYKARKLAGGKESALPINEDYTLLIEPLGREEDGRIRMQINVKMKPETKEAEPMNALSATLIVKAGDKIKLQGLRADGGELVIVMQAG